MAFDIYQTITDKIIAQMEQGIIPWQKPWISSNSCVSHVTGRPYSLDMPLDCDLSFFKVDILPTQSERFAQTKAEPIHIHDEIITTRPYDVIL